MSAERQVPGGQYVNETGTRQAQIPGGPYVNETVSAGAGVTASPGAGTVTATSYAPTAQRSYRIAVPAGTVTATGYAPSVERDYVAAPGAGTATATGYAPVVSAGDNHVAQPGAGTATATGYAPSVERDYVVRFRDRKTLLALALDPIGRFGDAYAGGRVEVEGSLVSALETVYRALGGRARPSLLRRLGTFVPHTLHRDRRNVHHHYDLGNDFYALWLDERMLYTCAYFESPDQTLEDAQVAKMDHVCRKLGLRRGRDGVRSGVRLGLAGPAHG